MGEGVVTQPLPLGQGVGQKHLGRAKVNGFTSMLNDIMNNLIQVFCVLTSSFP